MKRLTWQNYDMCQFCGEGACCEHYCDNTFPVCDDKAIYDRLAAYEDTGLEPCDYSAMAHALKQAERAREDLTEMIRQIGATGLDRLRELAEADREGRCVVLPRLEPGQGDPPGEPGPPGLCPNCNGWRGLVWDKTTGGSRCTICGWTNAKT